MSIPKEMKDETHFETILFVALIVVLLTAACGAEQGTTPTLAGTNVPGGNLTDTPSVDTTGTTETATPEAADTPTSMATVTTDATKTTETPIVPVTGVDILLIECQFCVDTMAHALLVLTDTATFDVVPPTTSTTTSMKDATCATVEVNNGKQVVLCSAPEKTVLTLNICTDVNKRTDFSVNLLAGPLITDKGTALPASKTVAPGTGNLTSTPSPSTPTPVASPSPTATP